MPKITSLDDYLTHLKRTFSSNGIETDGRTMAKYMKNKFEFFGLKQPLRKSLSREFRKTFGRVTPEQTIPFTKLCFDDVHRELHYFALEEVERSLKKQDTEFIDFLEELILTQSWWDSVDWLFKLCGLHFIRYPNLIPEKPEQWIQSENKWLNRVAILYPLHYKTEQLNLSFAFQLIEQQLDHPDFFVKKAIGWALRQFSKKHPQKVLDFIDNHELSALSKREGLKYLNKGK